ncbi:D-isomer specific 2-hydroxyacid dehydrogenase family protein [Abortiporus biennis]
MVDTDLPRIAILDDYQKVAFTFADWTPLRDRAIIDVYHDTLHDEDALAQRLEPYQIICAMRERTKFPASLLDRLPNLQLITTTGSKNRGIDLPHAKSKGIFVSNTTGGGNSTQEHIWALILGTARHLALEHSGLKASRQAWQTTIPIGLSGKTLGLVGVGKLGEGAAKIAKAFGVEFAASKEELFQSSDVVSIHMVLSERTYRLVTEADLRLMKPTAVFINTSRGPLVDEAGLIAVLKEKKIVGAGLDVFDVEPLPLDHPFRRLENVTLSPHLGYVSDDAYKVWWPETVENIVAFLDGKPQRPLSA